MANKIIVCGKCLREKFGGTKVIPFDHGFGVKEERTKRGNHLVEQIMFPPSGKRRCKFCKAKLRYAWLVHMEVDSDD